MQTKGTVWRGETQIASGAMHTCQALDLLK